MACATDNMKEAEQLIHNVILGNFIGKTMAICSWLLSINDKETHSVKCYQTFGKRPDIRFCIDRGRDCNGVKIMTGFLVIEPNFELMGLYSNNSSRCQYFKRDTDRRWRISATDTAGLDLAIIREHIFESYLEKVKYLNLKSAVSQENESHRTQYQTNIASTQIFI